MDPIYIELTLQKLHIRKRYHGYRLLSAATALALEDENRLLDVRDKIYRPVAERYGCNISNVERNIRTVSVRAWNDDRENLCQIAKYPLPSPPSASELIEIIMNYIQRTYPSPDSPRRTDSAPLPDTLE